MRDYAEELKSLYPEKKPVIKESTQEELKIKELELKIQSILLKEQQNENYIKELENESEQIKKEKEKIKTTLENKEKIISDYQKKGKLDEFGGIIYKKQPKRSADYTTITFRLDKATKQRLKERILMGTPLSEWIRSLISIELKRDAIQFEQPLGRCNPYSKSIN